MQDNGFIKTAHYLAKITPFILLPLISQHLQQQH